MREWTIREMPREERPRERLLGGGASSLSDAELLAILLRTGAPGLSALALARRLLEAHGGLVGLVGVSAAEIVQPGVGPAKAATLLAAIELARRAARAELRERPVLGRPAAVAEYLHLRYRCPGQEVLGALYLDTRHRAIRDLELFRGTLDRAAAEPRGVLKPGILLDAKSFVLFHTHPSGDPAPSVQDLEFTRAVAEAGRIVGIEMLDHLILGDGRRWTSLRERGAW